MVHNNVHSSTKHMNFPSWPCHGGSGYAGYASCGKPKVHDDITKLQVTLSILSMSWTSEKNQINRIHQTFLIQHDLLVHKCNRVSPKIALNNWTLVLLRALPDQKIQNCSLWTARWDAMGTRKISIENPQSVSTCKQASPPNLPNESKNMFRDTQKSSEPCPNLFTCSNSHVRRFAMEREHLQTGCMFSCEKNHLPAQVKHKLC